MLPKQKTYNLLCLIFLSLIACLNVKTAYSDEIKHDALLAFSYEESEPVSFTILDGDKPIGIVDSYIHQGGLLVSLNQFLNILNFNSNLDLQERTIEGWYGHPSNKFILFASKNQIILSGKVFKYGTEQVVMTDKDIFADISFITKYFPMKVSVDYTTLELSLKLKLPTISKEEVVDIKKESIDELIENNLTDVEIVAPAEIIEKDVEVVYKPLTKLVINEDNYLVFELTLGSLVYDELVDVYQHGQHFYVSLGQVADALEFAINIDAKNKKAEGWYLKEKNRFSINIETMKVVNKGQEFDLGEGEAFVTENDIFIYLPLLNKWFPLDAEINYAGQVLDIKMSELLPFQLKKKREIKRDRWLTAKEGDKAYPKFKPPYSISQLPFVDVNLNSTFTETGGISNFTSNYSTLMSADMKYANTDWFIAGNKDELSNLRFKATRNDRDGGIFGLTRIEAGDVESFDTELIAGRQIGRGIVLSNYPLNRPTQFDSTTISGDYQTGWEVELYNNTTLIGFQIVSDDGRYQFDDVPIFYGNNSIKLIFYGPQGEIREETRQFDINDSILKKGEYHYRLSAGHRNQDLFDVERIARDERLRVTGETEYGISDKLTFFASTTYDELEVSDHIYQTIGLSASLFDRVLARVNGAYDVDDKSWAVRFSGDTRIFDTNIKLTQQFQNNFINQSNESRAEDTSMRSALSLKGAFKAPFTTGVSYTLGGQYEIFKSGREIQIYNNSLSTSISGLTFTNNLLAEFDNLTSGSRTDFEGGLSARGRFNKTVVRFDSNYEFHPDKEIEDISLSLQRRLTKEYDARLGVRKEFFGENTASITGAINLTKDYFRLGTNFSVDDNNDYSIGMNVAFSLYQEPRSRKFYMQERPMSSSGAISALAFLDENYNNVFDEGEEALENVEFYRGKRRYTDDQNIAFISGIASNEYTDINIVAESLEDSLWQPAAEGFSVLGRAGVTAKIDFPVVETSEIEGTVYFGEDSMPGLTLYLVTSDGKQLGETKTEFDGFYLFTKILPAKYNIVVSDQQLNELGIRPVNKTIITVENGSDIYSGNDIDLEIAPPPPVTINYSELRIPTEKVMAQFYKQTNSSPLNFRPIIMRKPIILGKR